MPFNDLVYLVDIDHVLDKQSGKNKLQIVKETQAFADRQEVGLEEYSSATTSKIVLVASYEIPAYAYHGEKYLLTGDKKKQFEIYRVAKGRNPGFLRLPVRAVQSKNLLDGMSSE